MIKKIARLTAIIELAIGLATFVGITSYALLSLSNKPPSVFMFVFASSIISFAIGIGLFNYKDWARTLLVFFSGYIILTKVLVFTGLAHFSGEIITLIPAAFINCASILYHGFIMIFFTRRNVKENFRGA